MGSTHKPEFVQREKDILKFWEENRIFARLVEKNRGGPKYSFIDGPITANNAMGVHHAWGRTLKDIIQRYKGLNGFEQRYQNGFDCQGLWVEVEVEKAMQIGSKSEIEGIGLEKFARLCRERVMKYSRVQLEQSVRLGQWMDWSNNYYTMSNVNNLYIWHFLKKCNERGWITRGESPMPWCPRCGTSLSQHELSEGYRDVTHKSVFLLFPLLDRDNEFLLVWTTTPWTLTANVAAAVHPEATYAKVSQDGKYIYVAEPLLKVLKPGFDVVETIKGAELVGRKYRGPFAELEACRGVRYQVVAWNEVSMGEGTGIVHIAPGCGPEDFQLGKELGLSLVSPIDEAGIFLTGFGSLTGKHASLAGEEIFEDLRAKGILYKTEKYTHSYPHCWRDGTELLYRLVTEWFINPDAPFGDGKTVRQHILDANDTVIWNPPYMKRRMNDWLENMQSWCISRKRFWGLPLPFYVGESGDHFTVIGSLAELERLAIDEDKPKVRALPEVHRPWIDEIRIRDPRTGEVLRRIPEVGDCWLDAGIVPFSTLGYGDLIPYEKYKPEQDALNGAESRALFPEPSFGSEYWREWFPAESICEMRAQTRGWFYSLLFMSVGLSDQTPYKRVYTYEDVRDERGEEMHKSRGNAIWFDDVVEDVGADPLRWLYAGQNPSSPLLFGYNVAHEKTKKLLDIWNIFKFFNTYAELDKPRLENFDFSRAELTHLDRWLLSKLQTFVAAARESYEGYEIHRLDKLVEEFVDDISNWYIRRNRRRFWKSSYNENKRAAYMTLGHVLLTTSQAISPIIPFMAEQMFQGLRPYLENPADSIHLLPFPQPDESLRNADIEDQVGIVREVVSAALAARGAANIRVRQVLNRMFLSVPERFRKVVEDFRDEILQEVNVRDYSFVDSIAAYETVQVKPNFAALKARIVPTKMKAVIEHIKTTAPDELLGEVRAGKTEFGEEDLLVERLAKEGFAVHSFGEVSVALDITLDEELLQEGFVRDFVRKLQTHRRDQGLQVDQRIRVRLRAEPDVLDVLKQRADYISDELLAEDITFDPPGNDDPNAHQVTVRDATVAVAIEPV